MSTRLNGHTFKWTNNPYQQELDKYLQLEMCKDIAEGVRMQCRQEYFPEDEQEIRAAQLYTVTEEGRKNIPTENLVTERYLAVCLISIIISITQQQEFQS